MRSQPDDTPLPSHHPHLLFVASPLAHEPEQSQVAGHTVAAGAEAQSSLDRHQQPSSVTSC